MVTPIKCLVLAAIGGALSAVSINILAFAAHREGQGAPRQRRALPLNLLTSAAAAVIFIQACAYGPVALAMPVQTASQLLSNVLIQAASGMKVFTKSMRIGTLTVACSIICLIDVGPSEQEGQDPMELIMHRTSLSFLVFTAFLFLSGAYAAKTMPADVAPDSVNMLFSFAFMQATTIVLMTSIGKFLSLFEGWMFWIFLAGYLVISVINILVSSAASRFTDASIYVPLFASVKLICNCLAGLCIWDDFATIGNTLTSYTMVYVLVLMGVYLLSSFDMIQQVALRRKYTIVDPLQEAHMDPFVNPMMGRTFEELLLIWRGPRPAAVSWDIEDEGQQPPEEVAANKLVTRLFTMGLESGHLNDRAFLNLSMHLLNGKCSRITPELIDWMEESLSPAEDILAELRNLADAPSRRFSRSYTAPLGSQKSSGGNITELAVGWRKSVSGV